MTSRGHIHNGTIVLDTPPHLPEGAEVEVHIKPIEQRTAKKATIEQLVEDIHYDFDALDRLREASKL